MADASATEYVRTHVESPNVNTSLDRKLIDNVDISTGASLLRDKAVQTPFFGFTGAFTDVYVPSFITALTEKATNELIADRSNLTNKEFFTRLGGVSGRAKMLEQQLSGSNENSVVLINALSIVGNNTNLDFISSVPHDWQTIWNLGGNVEASACDPNPHNKLIIINGDITSPLGLLSALHEIGHSVDLSRDPDKITQIHHAQEVLTALTAEELGSLGIESETIDALVQARGDMTVTDKDIRIFLESERNAWAFALKNISNLISDRAVIVELQKYIHGDVMRKQSEFLRSRGVIH